VVKLRAFCALTAYTSYSIRSREQIRIADLHFTSKIFSAWQRSVVDTRTRRRMPEYLQAINAAFDRWASRVEEIQRSRELEQECVRMVSLKRMSRAMDLIRANAVVSRKTRLKSERVRAAREKREMELAVIRWREVRSERAKRASCENENFEHPVGATT